MNIGVKAELRSVGLTENPHRALFRCNQFVLGPQCAPGLEDWARIIAGPRLQLTTHPGLNVVQAGSGSKRLTLLGTMLDPHAPERSDQQILEKLLDRFDSLDSLIAATGPLGGRWAIVAVDGEEAHLFNDAFGLRQVFYTLPGSRGEVFAMSEAALGAVMLDIPVDTAAQGYMESEIFRAEREYKWPLSASAFCGVRRLLPNHVLDVRRGISRRFWPKIPLEELPLDAVVEKAARLLRGVMRAAANRFDLAVSVTCGIDSRVVLAACRDIVGRASFVTLRQWHMSDTSPDIVIPAALLAKLGLEHEVILAPVTVTPDFGQIFKSSSYLAHDHYGPDAQAIFERFGRTRVAVTGSGAEVARCGGRERLPYFDRKRASAAYLARHEMGGRNEFVERYFGDWLRDVGDQNNANVMDLFEWEQSCGSWLAATQLEFDVAWKDIVTPFNCRELMTSMLSAPSQYRKGLVPPLFERLVRELWPEALDAPINPHKQPRPLAKYLHAPLELLRHAAHLFRYR